MWQYVFRQSMCGYFYYFFLHFFVVIFFFFFVVFMVAGNIKTVEMINRFVPVYSIFFGKISSNICCCCLCCWFLCWANKTRFNVNTIVWILYSTLVSSREGKFFFFFCRSFTCLSVCLCLLAIFQYFSTLFSVDFSFHVSLLLLRWNVFSSYKIE